MGTIAVVIGMTVASVGSSIAQKLLTGAGKGDEAIMVDLTVKSALVVTALTQFARAMKALGMLG